MPPRDIARSSSGGLSAARIGMLVWRGIASVGECVGRLRRVYLTRHGGGVLVGLTLLTSLGGEGEWPGEAVGEL